MWIMRVCAIVTLAMIGGASCATAPKTPTERRDLEARAQVTLQGMLARDAGLRDVLATSAGYAVFPEIGKGGLIVGAAYGRGVVYEDGRFAGFVELNQASLGAQLGAQTFSELIVFRDRAALDRLKAGKFSFGANVSAVVLTAGAAASAEFRDGVSVFTVPRGGLMAEVSLSGQKLNFQPST